MREKASKAGCPSFSQLLRNSLVELIGVHHTWQQLVTPGNSWSQLFFGGTLSLFFCYPSEKSASWCRNITDRRWILPSSSSPVTQAGHQLATAAGHQACHHLVTRYKSMLCLRDFPVWW